MSENKMLDIFDNLINEGKIEIGKSDLEDFYSNLDRDQLCQIMESFEKEDKSDPLELMMLLLYMETGEDKEYTHEELQNIFALFFIGITCEINVREGHMIKNGRQKLVGDDKCSFSLTKAGKNFVESKLTSKGIE